MKPTLLGHPFAKVEFATENGDVEITQQVQINDKNMDIDIISLTTNRDVGADDCATFNIVLVYRDEWYKYINGNDFVKISLGRGYEAQPVLFGLVDTVNKSWSFIDLKPVRTITVSGRGFNKALIQFGIGAIQELDAGAQWGGFFSGQTEGFGLPQASSEGGGSGGGGGGIRPFKEDTEDFGRVTMANAVQAVFDYYTNKGIDMRFANGRTWKSYVNLINIDDGKAIAIGSVENYYTYQGNLWDYIKELRNAPFYETFWEIIDGTPTMIVRPTPFNPSEWNGLEKVEVKDIELIDESTGRSDLETYSVFSVKSEEVSGQLNLIFGQPIWYKPYYRKYGIRRYQATSKYIPTGEAPNYALTGIETPGKNVYEPDNLEEWVSQRAVDLFNWNIKNPQMENGKISVYGHVRYKVGTRLTIEHSGMEYYLEHVEHKFIYNENWITNLDVTRGLMPNERFTSPWNDYEIMTALDYQEITGKEAKPPEVADTSITGNSQGNSNNQKNNSNSTGNKGTINNTGTGKTGNMNAPVTGRVSSEFGNRIHPISKKQKLHTGIDLAAPSGTPVKAAQGGTVAAARFMKGYGNCIFIDHPDGSQTRYAHLSEINVAQGQKVDVGSDIGKVGSTGNSTGPHLHFEVRIDDKPVNPRDYVKF